jgi:hypothetical protein
VIEEENLSSIVLKRVRRFVSAAVDSPALADNLSAVLTADSITGKAGVLRHAAV